MQIGCPTEMKPQEFRVGMTPNAVSEATRHGHKVMVQAVQALDRAFRMLNIKAPGRKLLRQQKKSSPVAI